MLLFMLAFTQKIIVFSKREYLSVVIVSNAQLERW